MKHLNELNTTYSQNNCRESNNLKSWILFFFLFYQQNDVENFKSQRFKAVKVKILFKQPRFFTVYSYSPRNVDTKNGFFHFFQSKIEYFVAFLLNLLWRDFIISRGSILVSEFAKTGESFRIKQSKLQKLATICSILASFVFMQNFFLLITRYWSNKRYKTFLETILATAS